MKLLEVKLKANKKFDGYNGETLRGYFGNTFIDEVEFHNHLGETNFKYDFAYIQYRVIDGVLSLLGIDKGADILLEKLPNIKEVRIGDEVVSVVPEINISFPEVSIEDEMKYSYKFKTLWFALNDRNYKRYKEGDFDLNKQLRNNILEFCKMVNLWADKKIEVSGEFKEESVTKRENKFVLFSGTFKSNVKLPNHISLGKRKSIGFGIIEKIERR